MLPQPDFGVHAGKGDMAPVILPGTGGIEQLIVACDQRVPPVRVFPYPVTESVLDGLLLLLCQRRFLAVQYTALLAVCVVLGIIDTHIAEIQGILQNLVGVCPFRAVGHIRGDIVIADRAFVLDVPFRRKGGIIYVDHAPLIERGLKGLPHEFPDIFRVDPCCAEPYLDL